MLNAIRWFIVATLLLLLFGAGAAGVLFLYALQDTPVVPRSAPADYVTVADGKAFVKRIKKQVEAAGEESTTLVATEEELKRLAQIGSHTFKWLDADVDIGASVVNARLSVRLPDNPFGRFLNLGGQVRSSEDGLEIDQLALGPLRVPGQWLLPLTARVMDGLLRDKQVSQLLQGINVVQVVGDTVLLSVSPPPDVKERLKQAVRTLQAYRFPDGEEQRVSHYYGLLVQQGELAGGGPHSLSLYLSPLMREAQQRSSAGSAVTENRSAIWALVIYLSNGAFETLIGKLVSSQRELVRSPYPITLAGRSDLTVHFFMSAGIALASQEGVSMAAGEFKELLDSGAGSGFSFVDLAADRAGIQFATRATAGEAQAKQVQQILAAGPDEITFFPDISGLLEGVKDEQFRTQYGDVYSQRFLREVERINQRIVYLPIYKMAGVMASDTN